MIKYFKMNSSKTLEKIDPQNLTFLKTEIIAYIVVSNRKIFTISNIWADYSFLL